MGKERKRPGYRNVFALGFVSFFTDVSTEMILGILPVYVVQELGATRAALGLMEGIAEMTNYMFRLISGVLSDKLGKRKLFVFIGYAFSGIAKPMFAFAKTWLDALIVRTLDRLGKGIRTSPRDALISQSVKEKEAGKAFGIHRTLDQLGAVLGPLTAFIIVPLYGARTLFLISFIPAAIALVILAFFVVDVKIERKPRGILEGASKILRGSFLLLLASLVIFNVGAYNFSFVIVRAQELGIPLAAAPLVYMLINLTHTAVGFPSGIAADKWGREKVLLLSFLMFSLTSFILVFATGSWLDAVLIALLFGVFQGMYDTVSRAVLPRYVPEELRGTAYGVYYIAIGLAFLLGISTVGYLWDAYGRQVAFLYSTVTSICSALLLGFLIKQTKT